MVLGVVLVVLVVVVVVVLCFLNACIAVPFLIWRQIVHKIRTWQSRCASLHSTSSKFSAITAEGFYSMVFGDDDCLCFITLVLLSFCFLFMLINKYVHVC